MTVEPDPLVAAIGSVDERLVELHDTLVEENVKRDKRIRRSVVAIVASLVVAVGGVAVGAHGYHELGQYKHEIAASRVVSCLQYNAQETQAAASDKAEFAGWVNFLVEHRKPTDPPTDDHLLATLFVYYDRLVDQGHQPRDCSAAGIARYISQPPSTTP